jgi:hypothetical protein
MATVTGNKMRRITFEEYVKDKYNLKAEKVTETLWAKDRTPLPEKLGRYTADELRESLEAVLNGEAGHWSRRPWIKYSSKEAKPFREFLSDLISEKE